MCEGGESGCRGPGDVVASVRVGVDNVYSGHEREDAFFERTCRIVMPIVESGGMRDRVQLFRFGGDEIAARGGQRVHVSNGVDGLSGDGADLLAVHFDHPFITPRDEALGGGDLACVVQRVQSGL